MATLTRPKNESQTNTTLSSNIPTPFPRERLLRAELLQALSTDEFQPNPAQAEAGPSRIVKQDERQEEADIELDSSVTDSGVVSMPDNLQSKQCAQLRRSSMSFYRQ